MAIKNFEFLNIILNKQDKFTQYILNNKNHKHNILICHIFILIGSMIYGCITGSFTGGTQILFNSVKIPIVLIGLFYISLPIFYVFDMFFYGKLKLDQIAIILLSGYIITTIILIAFTPLILLFSITTTNENFLILLNTSIGAMALFCGLVFIYNLFNRIHKNVQANIALLIGYFIIFFSGPQLIWALRPYFHSVDSFTEPVKSNFYIEILKVAANEPILTIIFTGLFSLLTLFIIMNYIFKVNVNEDMESVNTNHKSRQTERIKKEIKKHDRPIKVENRFEPEDNKLKLIQSNPFEHPDYLQYHLNNKPHIIFKFNETDLKS